MDLSHAAKIPSMEEWRSHWKRFLESCQEIRIFSEDSLFMLKKIYESLEQLHIVSEQNTRFPRLKRRFKNTDYVNVALLGPLGELEGLEMVKSLVRTADMKNLNIRFSCSAMRRKKSHPSILRRFPVSASLRFPT